MEMNNDIEKSEKIQKKNIMTDNLYKNDNSLFNPNTNSSEGEQSQKRKQSNKLELDKEIFQIIQQNSTYNGINDKNFLNKNKINESLNNLNKPDVKTNENEINDSKINNAKIKLSEINEISNKNYKADIFKSMPNSNSKKNDKNVYTLLNSYYKDVNLDFNNPKIKRNGKNFLHKDIFQEPSNLKNSQNNLNIPSNYYPYYYKSQYIKNNNYLDADYYDASPHIFPANSFIINNHYNNYYLNNYIFNTYNFNKIKSKHNKRNKDNIDPSFFMINLDNIIKGIDKRTTIMIRHIPNKYSYQNLLEEINIVCKDKYDCFYLPLDSENNCNLGYAFINFIHPLHIVFFYHTFKSRKWLHFNSYKECDLSFAKYQGKYELTSNIEKNMGKSGDKRRLPIIFEVKNPPKIDLFKQYYEMIKKFSPELLNDINWI